MFKRQKILLSLSQVPPYLLDLESSLLRMFTKNDCWVECTPASTSVNVVIFRRHETRFVFYTFLIFWYLNIILLTLWAFKKSNEGGGEGND